MAKSAETETFNILHRFTGAVLFAATITCSPNTAPSVKMGLAVKVAVEADANLADANLADANLARANLADAKGVTPERVTHLSSLKFCAGTITAFKVVNSRGEGHVNGGVKYIIGERVEELTADTDVNLTCSHGLNVADLPWCLREWREGYRILAVEHSVADIACVPIGTDGKYRLFGCTPVKDITDDLRACGALPALAVAEAA